jgi:DNA mismatch repair ATPase MutL
LVPVLFNSTGTHEGISAVPATVTDPEIALLAALHALAGGEDLAKALACKGSTRFGENLSSEEMEMLLKEWSATEFRDTNPRSSQNI